MAGRSLCATSGALKAITPICTQGDADCTDIYLTNQKHDYKFHKIVYSVRDNTRPKGFPEDGIRSKTKVIIAAVPYDLSEDKANHLFTIYCFVANSVQTQIKKLFQTHYLFTIESAPPPIPGGTPTGSRLQTILQPDLGKDDSSTHSRRLGRGKRRNEAYWQEFIADSGRVSPLPIRYFGAKARTIPSMTVNVYSRAHEANL